MTEPISPDDRSLLITLDESSRLVQESHDPHQTLTNIVRLIQDRFHTAVCSVYLLEHEQQELVLGATIGLKPESVGRVRMRVQEGLTGLVAEQKAPVMVADAFKHPRFKYFPEAGEDPYRSFLGVPLIEGGVLEGVLVVQTTESRNFSPAEVRMLSAIGAQVASLVGDAHLLDRVLAIAHGQQFLAPQLPVQEVVRVQGVSLSPGMGLGQAYIVDGFSEWRATVPLISTNPAEEKRRLAQALHEARQELILQSQRISELVGEDHGAILQAQLMIMQDRGIEQDLTNCLDAGASAEGAIFQTLDKYVAAFQQLTTPYFQERVHDIKDVFHRLLWQLRTRPIGLGVGPESIVLLAHEASVMELFAVSLDQLAAVIVEHGSASSHAAILARSLGIPMIGQVRNFGALLAPGRRLLVDGTEGIVYLDPAPDFVVPRARAPEVPDSLPPLSLQPGMPRLEANINLLCEVHPAVKRGATGVGLYRSEFLFLARRTLPTEEEQVSLYRKLLTQMDGRPVTIRTFDLRPDKLMSYSHLSLAAARPFDWRLVLDSGPLQQLFRDQVRAILRAGAPSHGATQRIGPVRLVVPLVTSTELLDFVVQTLAQARTDLEQEGLEFTAHPPLGVMIEVAAAAPLVELWAHQVDFFALGTNDLTASALGLDRDDPQTANQLDPLHPGLLRLIDSVVVQAHKAGKPVTVCGEMATDPQGLLALVALQVDSLSVAVHQLPTVRRILTNLSVERVRQIRDPLFRCRTSSECREFLRQWARPLTEGVRS